MPQINEGSQIQVSRGQECKLSVEPRLAKVQIGFRVCNRLSVYVRHIFSIFMGCKNIQCIFFSVIYTTEFFLSVAAIFNSSYNFKVSETISYS